MGTLLQRPLKGSRISTFYPVKSLPPLSSLDSAFQLQEYISLIIRLDIHDVDAIVSIPGPRGGKEENIEDNVVAQAEESEGEREAKGEFAVDEACWIYEQLRRLAQDLSHPLITMLQQECTRESCPEMKAGEWLYLCVAHGNEGAMEQCCAIDYILHTVDSATALLNSPRAFPSRISIPQTSHRHFSSLARRLGRIFAHAYFHHREVFEQAEAESSLYARFLALTSKFDLVPPEFLVIPTRISPEDHLSDVSPPRLLAAAVDPRHMQDLDDGERGRNVEHTFAQGGLGLGHSPARVGVDRNPSPRKGRNRTGTMVFSEASIVVEELARSEERKPAVQLPIELSKEKVEPTPEPEVMPPPPGPTEIPDRAPEYVEPPAVEEPLVVREPQQPAAEKPDVEEANEPEPVEQFSPVDEVPVAESEDETEPTLVETPSDIPSDATEAELDEVELNVEHDEEDSRDVTESAEATSPNHPEVPAATVESTTVVSAVESENGGIKAGDVVEEPPAMTPSNTMMKAEPEVEEEEEDVTEASVEHEEEHEEASMKTVMATPSALEDQPRTS